MPQVKIIGCLLVLTRCFSCPQVFELLTDLKTAFLNGREYFLGAIVTTRPEECRSCRPEPTSGRTRACSEAAG
jgi:hypothetical protein